MTKIVCTHHTVPMLHLPKELEGLRMVQLSDFHRSHMTEDSLLQQAVALANETCPDLIVLTGDFVSFLAEDIAPCMRILAPLRAPLGIFAVLGNHDYVAGAKKVEQGLTELGIQVLTNQNVRLECGLRIVGVEDNRHGRPDVVRAFAGVGPEEPVLTLVHNPAIAELFTEQTCLALAGHSHGGQICVPILTTRQVERIGAKHYRAGWFTLGKTRLYVNRGLGQVGLPF